MRLLTERYFKWMLNLMTVMAILLAGAGQACCESEDSIVHWVATVPIHSFNLSMHFKKFSICMFDRGPYPMNLVQITADEPLPRGSTPQSYLSANIFLRDDGSE